MKNNNSHLEKIINEIDEICSATPCDIEELNYAELLYLHFILETHESYDKVTLTEDKFPHEFDQSIIEGLIRKNFLMYFQINSARLVNFINENSSSFNQVQKDYFDLLSSYFRTSYVLINEHQIKYSDLKNLIFCELQNYISIKYEDIKGLEILIKNNQREKALEIFRKYMKRYNFRIAENTGLLNKLDEIVWEISILNFDQLLNKTCRSVAADIRLDGEKNKFLQNYFLKRLNYFFSIPEITYQQEKNQVNFTRSSIDTFIECNLSLDAGELDLLSGSQIINIWIKKPRIENKFSTVN